jgi:uracil-DNA glycosylase
VVHSVVPFVGIAAVQGRGMTTLGGREGPEKRLQELRREAAGCRRCGLWHSATQTVFGEGQAHARLMLVGEQPGDQEDKQGHPFVGPAGRILDKGVEASGLIRKDLFLTNAVKHFKFEPRGAKRQHRSPDAGEIAACRHWLEQELAVVRPLLVIALGRTAARSVFGKATPIQKNRGRFFPLDGFHATVTIHPSALLRLPEKEDRRAQFDLFVRDLRAASLFLEKGLSTSRK